MAKNPFAQLKQPLQLTFEGDAATLDIIELRAEEIALAITRHVDPVKPYLVLIVDDAGCEQMQAIAQQVAAQMKTQVQERRLQLEPIDWVKQVQKDFPPFTLGRFYVHGSHAKEHLPKNRFPLLIDAAAAFGTGEHSTTAGCLQALEWLHRQRPHAPEILDMGAGTAILAIGAAYLWKHARITACDNDAVAVEVSDVNLKANRVEARSDSYVSDGYRHARVRRKQYDIVIANILAKPLVKMAKDAVRVMKPNGSLILSGLLNEQENMVLAAHRAQGLHMVKRIRRNNWSILVLRASAFAPAAARGRGRAVAAPGHPFRDRWGWGLLSCRPQPSYCRWI